MTDLNYLTRNELLVVIRLAAPPTEIMIATARLVAAEEEWARLFQLTAMARVARRQTRIAYEANPNSIPHREAFEEADIDVRRAELAAGREWSRIQQLAIALQALNQSEAA